VTIGDTGFSLEVPEGLNLKSLGVKKLKSQILRESRAYMGNTKDGLQVIVYTFDSPASKVAGTFFTPITDGFYKGLISGLYGQKVKIQFDSQKILGNDKKFGSG